MVAALAAADDDAAPSGDAARALGPDPRRLHPDAAPRGAELGSPLHLLADPKRHLEQAVEVRADVLRDDGLTERAADLSEDVHVTEHLGLEARGDPEEVVGHVHGRAEPRGRGQGPGLVAGSVHQQ